MDKNPILISYKSKLLYAGIWLVITAVQVGAVSFPAHVPLEYRILDSMVFNLIAAFLLIPVWYPVRFSGWEGKSWQFHVLAHLALLLIFVGLCLSCWNFILWLCISDNGDYIRFLQSSQWWKISQSFLVYLIAALTYYLYLYIEKVKEKAKNEIRLNQLIKDNELNLLKSQINPHFLFNSLNSVNSLIISRPEQANKMLVALSDYLRYAVLANNNIYSSLQLEIENIERYLSIEKFRFGEKLQYKLDIEQDCLPLKIPVMLLQPLFENAVKHGVYESLQTVTVSAQASKDEQGLTIVVSNDYDAENVSRKKGSETGLKNVRARLHLSYGAEANLHTKVEGSKFVATLKIPQEEMC